MKTLGVKAEGFFLDFPSEKMRKRCARSQKGECMRTLEEAGADAFVLEEFFDGFGVERFEPAE